MTLEQQIIEKLEHTSHNEVLKAMGYTRLEHHTERLKMFIKISNIYIWLKDGSFDYLYDSQGFVKKLIQVLKLSSTDTDELISKHRMILNQINNQQEPYIYIDTKFERSGKAMHDLYKVRYKQRIMVRKELLVLLSKDECINMVESLIKEHHIQTQGDLGILGKVRFYYFSNSNGNIYGFDRYGERL